MQHFFQWSPAFVQKPFGCKISVNIHSKIVLMLFVIDAKEETIAATNAAKVILEAHLVITTSSLGTLDQIFQDQDK